MPESSTPAKPRIVLLLACILLATACSGPLVIGTVYNGAGKKISKEMKQYAKFSVEQRKEIDTRFAQYQQWHRSTQLPLYSAFLKEISTELESENKISPDTVSSWVTRISDLSLAVRYCNPLNDSTDFWTTLTAPQITQIKNKSAVVHALRVKKYTSETPGERSVRRHKSITTAAKRAGVKFNSQQSDLLSETLAQQTSLGGQRLLLWEKWTDEFNLLLQRIDKPEFKMAMNNHIHKLWTLTQDNYSEQWQSSTRLWTNFVYDFLALQTEQQNLALQKITNRFAETLTVIREDNTSSATPVCFKR